MLKKMCAWCNEFLGEYIDDGTDVLKESHGICPNCANDLIAESDFPLNEFIDALDIPVLILDQNGVVVSNNSKAEKFIGKSLQTMQGALSGEVFECPYHKLAGGCGKTTHCETCTIRTSVQYTFETGQPLHDVPAFVNLNQSRKSQGVAVSISTELKNRIVILKMQKIAQN